ncbi:MAG TPA: carboxypeptidase-like regulatory domain-containing protein [Fulvivirga sp.]|nr:carboxypeptidase-like regulatory domain-containing protein [Fulvivirga sp.]
MKSYLEVLILSLVLIAFEGHSQNKHTLSGTLTDKETGEALIGATIFITAIKKGTITNNYGFYSLTIPESDSIGVVFSYLGYVPQIKKIYFKNDIGLNIALEPSDKLLDEVIVKAQRTDENVQRAQMGVVDIPIEGGRERILSEPQTCHR